MKRFSVVLLSLMLFVTMTAVTAAAGPEIIFAISTPKGSLMQMTGEEFTRRANEALGDRAKVVYYHSAQLGKDKDLMQKIKIGTVHLTLMASVMPNYVPETALFDMPYLVKDRKHLERINQEVVIPYINPAMEKKGYKLLGLWENGFRQITNNERPITLPADLDGIKLRTPKSKWRVKMFKAYGANPTPMAFSEVFVALQTGVIDGQENPLNHIYASKLQEVQKYLSISYHVYGPAWLIAYGKTWDKIPADVQKVLLETAQSVRPWLYAKAEESDNKLVDTLKQAGMEVNNVDRAAFVKASAPIYEEFAKEVKGGKEMVDKAIALAD